MGCTRQYTNKVLYRLPWQELLSYIFWQNQLLVFSKSIPSLVEPCLEFAFSLVLSVTTVEFTHISQCGASTYAPREYYSVCPLVGIGTPHPPLPQASVSPPPESKGGTLACGPVVEGVGESQFEKA